MSKIECDVYQDGADFYADNAEELTIDNSHLAKAPFRVTDYDMSAAICARNWFITVWCPANNINPTFV